MAQQINDNFSILAGLPLDDRNAKTTIGLRDAIPATLRFEGLLCYVSQTSTLYQLQGGIENSNWKGIAGNNVTSDFETEIEGFLALSAGKTTLNAWEVGDKFRGWIGTRYVVGSIVSLPVSLPSDIDDSAKVSLEVDSNETSSNFEQNKNKIVTVDNDGNYNAFPSVVELPNGNLIMVYRKGVAHEGNDGIIVSRTSIDKGINWSSASTALSISGFDLRDPSLTVLANGELLMTYFSGDSGLNSLECYSLKSTDSGVTWGSPVAMGGYATWGAVTAPAIQLTNGDLLVSTYGRDGANAKTIVFKSTNNGGSWSVLSSISTQTYTTDGPFYYTEPVLLLLNNGDILASLRNELTSKTSISLSTDSGVTWGAISDKFDSQSRANMNLSEDRIIFTYRSNASYNFLRPASRYSDDSGVTFSEQENILSDVGIDVYSSLVPLEKYTFGDVYSLEESGSKADIYFRYFFDSRDVSAENSLNTNGVVNHGTSILRGDLSVGVDDDYFKVSAANGFTEIKNNLQLTQTATNGTRYILTNESESGTGRLVVQAGGGSGGYGGGLITYGASHETRPGYVTAGLSNASNAKFTVNDDGLGGGNDLFSVDRVSGVVNILNLAGSEDRVVSRNTSGNLIISAAPTAPTAAVGTNTTQIATMAAVQTAITNNGIITTATNITNATLTDTSLPQNGKTLYISNGATNINYTVNGGITASFVKGGTGSITFVQGSGRTMVAANGTLVFNGAQYSTASIVSFGTTDIVYINNF